MSPLQLIDTSDIYVSSLMGILWSLCIYYFQALNLPKPLDAGKGH